MARVAVKMFASVREDAGRSECDVDASDLGAVFDSLRATLGSSIARALDRRDSDPDSLVVLVNGRNIGRTAPSSVTLRDGDEVAIFPPVSGG